MLECQNYQNLTNGNRKNTYGAGVVTCDSSLSPGWFRFQGDAGIKMATTCVPDNHCGTHSTGWLNGAHPTVAEGQVTRQVCFNWNSNCCNWSINIQVLSCGDFFIYYISGTPPEHPCHLRYCGADWNMLWALKLNPGKDASKNPVPGILLKCSFYKISIPLSVSRKIHSQFSCG